MIEGIFVETFVKFMILIFLRVTSDQKFRLRLFLTKDENFLGKRDIFI